MILVLLFTNSSLTTITTDKLTSSGKLVDRQTTVIGTSTAIRHRSCIFQLVDLINGEHSRFCTFLMAFAGN